MDPGGRKRLCDANLVVGGELDACLLFTVSEGDIVDLDFAPERAMVFDKENGLRIR